MRINRVNVYQVASFKSYFCTNRVKVLASSFDDAIRMAQELFMTKEGRWIAVQLGV